MYRLITIVCLALAIVQANAVELGRVQSVPATGSGHSVFDIQEITLTWDNFSVGYGNRLNGWDDVANRIKVYFDEELLRARYDGTELGCTVEPVDFVEGSDRYASALRIIPDEPLDDALMWYILVIPSGTLSFVDKEGNTVQLNEEIELYYTVAGSDGLVVVPGQYQSIEYADFRGLELHGKDVEIVDASRVAIYRTYYMTPMDLVEVQPIGFGREGEADDCVLVEFDTEELYSGTYTIYAPTGAIKGFDGVVNFHLTGNDKPVEKLPLTILPESETELDSILSVTIYWDDFTMLTPKGSAVKGTLEYGGEETEIEFEIVKEQVPGDNDEGAGAEGMYYYSLRYTPEEPLTEPGEYVVTLPEGQVSVHIFGNQEETVNQRVSVRYEIGGYLVVSLN